MTLLHTVLLASLLTATTSATADATVAPAPLRVAQLGNVGSGGPSYGYQPYNDRNPTGFYHPNGMGFGSYSLTPKYHGHRFRTLRYRKFRGS
jgi:hypothetical protein